MLTTHAPYELYDIYECSPEEEEVLGKANDFESAYLIAYSWILETDGECCICYRPATNDIDNDFELLISQAIAKAMNDYFD